MAKMEVWLASHSKSQRIEEWCRRGIRRTLAALDKPVIAAVNAAAVGAAWRLGQSCAYSDHFH
jgi:enoyl-CoA hydratase/carnithine racemase